MLVEVEVREICRSNELNAVVLCETGGQRRQFPIYIGQFEAGALEMSVHDVQIPRPLTHDLLLSVIRSLGGSLKRVLVDKLQRDTFYSKLDIAVELEPGTVKNIWIDCRPSDALILASKSGAPLFVDESVLEATHAQPAEEDEDFDGLDGEDGQDEPDE